MVLQRAKNVGLVGMDLRRRSEKYLNHRDVNE